MKKLVLLLVAGMLLATPLLTLAQEEADTTQPAPRRELIWSIGVYTGDSPWNLTDPEEIDNPVFTYKDITDRNALFVADPFLFKYGDKYLMFMEVAQVEPYGHGDLAYAESEDGIHWEYKGVVLDEAFHLSYPQVFESNGEYYLLPETYQTSTMRLYKATDFPTEWKFIKTIVDVQNVDPSIFQEKGRWYIIAATDYDGGWDMTRIYTAKKLLGDWTEHPASPIVTHDANISRPAGRVMKVDGHWYRTAQDTYPTYGQNVQAFRIDTITKKKYAETPMGIVLEPHGEWWAVEGVHQIDAIQMPDGSWLGVIDGQSWQDYEPVAGDEEGNLEGMGGVPAEQEEE